MTDMVNHPPHYTTGAIECIEYIQDVLAEQEYIGYLRGQIIKYQHRLMAKEDPLQDLRKLQWYARRLEVFMCKLREKEHDRRMDDAAGN